MRPGPFFLRILLSFCALLPIISARALGQDNRALSRITGPVDENQLTAIRGNVHKMARPIFDHGPASPGLPMLRMLLVLKRSREQENALRKLLGEQQEKSSLSYHKWLTPEQFGHQFGTSDQDVQAILSWLQSHAFQIDKVARSRAVIEFSGTAAQVQEALHTEIHKYIVDGEEHWANSKDPEIPAALTPVVAGVATLHNFHKKPLIRIAENRIPAHMHLGSQPQVTLQSGLHGLGPGDVEVIYNMTSVIQGPPGMSGPPAGFGTTIAVVARSNINVQDVARFRNIFNLPNNNPQVFVNGPDPGDLGGGEEAEAVLDATWSGALAPGAEVSLVVSASTNTTDGVDLSELYIIDNSSGAIMTESFGGCEAGVTSAEAINISQLAEQAAAEGITYIVATGDVGSAGCEVPSETQATGPFSVNVLAATPFTVAVGGTEFNENGNDAHYWNSSNNQYTLASANSYIPENVWNESCTVAQCGTQKANIAASGGGASMYFTKPSWQSSVNGIPNDGMRDVPDVALAAAAAHDPYLLCLDGSCQPDAQGNFSFIAVGGTSAAAPSFAGMMALVNSAVVPLDSHPRLGQVNSVLYALAAQQNLSSCNGSSTSTPPASSCIFNDVTSGNNAVPGEVGYGTPTAKYQSGVGYDLASGLGSVNVANLIKGWNTVKFSPTTTTLSLSPTTFIHGTPVSVGIGVTSASGTPTGDVSLFRSGGGGGPVQGNVFTLSGSGSASASTSVLPGGYYTVAAQYAGDGKFMSSDSSSVLLNVTPEPSATVATVLTLDQSGKFTGFTQLPYGSFVYLRADVTGQSGVGYATGGINFSDGGASLPGNPYTLNSQGNTATPNGLFSFSLGQHSIVANYVGDPDFSASSSSVVGFTISQAPTSTALTPNSATQGGVCSATVNTNSGGAPPSGTVTFFIGGTQVGSPVPVTGIPAVTNTQTATTKGAQAVATFTDAGLSNGKYTISATYSGDNNYGASGAAPIVITVQPDYSLTASSNSMTITSPGGVGSSTLTINAINGFNGAVNFSCSNLPAMSSCQFSPPSVSGSGNTALTITTTAPVALLVHSERSYGVDRSTTGGEVTVAGIFLVAGMFWRRRWGKLFSLAAFALLMSVVGCGGGGSSGPPPPPPPNPGTSPGSYAVTVTATSGAITHNISLTVNVQ